jgi:hypothetical protein
VVESKAIAATVAAEDRSGDGVVAEPDWHRTRHGRPFAFTLDELDLATTTRAGTVQGMNKADELVVVLRHDPTIGPFVGLADTSYRTR